MQDNKFVYYMCIAVWLARAGKPNSTFLLKENNFAVYLYSYHQWHKVDNTQNAIEFIGRNNMKHITEEEAFRFILENE